MPFRKAVLSLAVLLLATAPLALAQGTYTQIDYPGSIQTLAYGIDIAGDISGSYADASNNEHGFVLSGGIYTTIDYPGATYTVVSGINDVGQVVGTTNNPSGFLYDYQTQTFTDIAYPGAASTSPFCINNTGAIGGWFVSDSNITQGFLLRGSTYHEIAPPTSNETFVDGITTSDEVVGNAETTNQGYIDFLSNQGKYSRLNIPNAPSASVNGVSKSGALLVGYYAESSQTAVGFLYRNKALRTLIFPGATYTIAFAVNDAGVVVGFFVDASGNYHGFTCVELVGTTDFFCNNSNLPSACYFFPAAAGGVQVCPRANQHKFATLRMGLSLLPGAPAPAMRLCTRLNVA